MKKILLTIFLVMSAVPVFAQALTIVYVDPPDNTIWKRTPSRALPYHYDIIVDLDGSKYAVKNLDEREFATVPQAIQEAKYQLKIEERPYIQSPNGLTLEQMQAREEFNTAYNHYINSKFLLDLGVITPEEAKIAKHKLKLREKYDLCIGLSVDVWSP